MDALEISCETCVLQDVDQTVCDECVVTFICGREADDAVVLDLADQRAVRLLAAAGLVPRLHHRAG